MPWGVRDVHTPSPTESLPSSAPRHGPLQPVGRRTEDSGLARTWPLPSLTGPWGGSGGCIHPAGVAPYPTSCSRHSNHRPGVLQGRPLFSPVLTHCGAGQGQKPPAGTSGSGTLGSGCPAGLLLTLGCQELGIMTSGNSGPVQAPAGTQKGPILSCSWSLSHTHTYTHTLQLPSEHSTRAVRNAGPHLPGLWPRWGPPPPPWAHTLVHTAPPHHHHLPAIPSGSHLLAPLGLTEEKHPFPEPHFLLSLLRAFLCTHRMYFCVLPRAALSMYKIP